MAKNKVTKGTFKDECKVINLHCEYEGYTGDEKYAIITDLTENQLNERYGQEINRYRPFVILTREMGEAMREFDRNNEKFAKREAREESVFITCSEEEEALLESLSVRDEQTILQEENEAEYAREHIRELSSKALESLTPLQREYLVRHILDGISIKELARESGKSRYTVLRTFHRGLKNYIRAIEDMEAES